MTLFRPLTHCVAGGFTLVLAFILSATNVHANIYATDIKIDGNLNSATASPGSAVSISYRLNESDATIVSVNILNGTAVVASIPGGTAMGLNTVSWTPPASGTYSVSITAAAAGFPFWTQISNDTNPGNYAFYPNGIAVDDNAHSPYYGRVVVGNSAEGTVTNNQKVTQYSDGIYKYNADGSPADEGGFGYGGYTNDDGGHININPGEMPSGSMVVPWLLRIGGDDRVYMLDYSSEGAIVAFDILVSSNSVVIDDGGTLGGHLGGPHNYSRNPDIGQLSYGINCFDVTSTDTTNAAVWLGDADLPSWGVWMYHMTNGSSDTNDQIGVQAVETGGDLSLVANAGLSVDTTLDIFISQDRYNANDPAARQMEFTNWNDGILPPESTDTNSLGPFGYVLGSTVGEALWSIGANDNTDTGINDTLISSRTHPKYVATPMNDTDGNSGGIRVLNTADGSVVSVTNGTTIQTLTNVDIANNYTCAAWDGVGNLYAASTTTNRWRVWSPPGANTNTTVAVARLIVSAQFAISSVTASSKAGSTTVTIIFTAQGNQAASGFTLLGSTTVNGAYTPVSGATITGGSGTYKAVAVSTSSAGFYKIEQ
ncbi:MAG: hypothetical protein ABSE48_08315 [Verrucomicrobiota bacterium]